MNERACDSDSKIGVVFALDIVVITTCRAEAPGSCRSHLNPVATTPVAQLTHICPEDSTMQAIQRAGANSIASAYQARSMPIRSRITQGNGATLQSLIKQIGGGGDANDGDSPAQRAAEAGKGSANAASNGVNTGTTAGASTSSAQQQVNVAGEHDTPAKEMMEKAYGLFRAASGVLSLV